MKLGSFDVDDFKIGSQAVDRIYLGSQLAWEPSAPPGLPLELRGVTTAIDTNTGTNTITVAAPAGLAEGDLVYLYVGANGNNHPPATWPGTFLFLDEYAARGSYIGAARDIMGPTPPADFTVSTSANQRMGIVCVAYKAGTFDLTTPEDGSDPANSVPNATNPIPVPGITTSVDGSWLINAISFQSTSSSHALGPPPSMSILGEAYYRTGGGFGGVLYVYSEIIDPAGDTGSRDWVNANSRPHGYYPHGVRQAV